jgi:hypothetical protein
MRRWRTAVRRIGGGIGCGGIDNGLITVDDVKSNQVAVLPFTVLQCIPSRGHGIRWRASWNVHERPSVHTSTELNGWCANAWLTVVLFIVIKTYPNFNRASCSSVKKAGKCICIEYSSFCKVNTADVHSDFQCWEDVV